MTSYNVPTTFSVQLVFRKFSNNLLFRIKSKSKNCRIPESKFINDDQNSKMNKNQCLNETKYFINKKFNFRFIM